MKLTFKLTEQQKALFTLVCKYHGEQKRKYTGEPYTNHLIEVANLVCHLQEEYPYIVEVALCHDILEDCTINGRKVEWRDLLRDLYGIYDSRTAHMIVDGVIELTDVFTHEDYPAINRAKRKELEAERLSKVSELTQTVKYADMISNSTSICKHDSKFAKIYLQEKNNMLKLMKDGESDLYFTAIIELYNNNKLINKNN